MYQQLYLKDTFLRHNLLDTICKYSTLIYMLNLNKPNMMCCWLLTLLS